MNILGVNYFFHDTSACVVRDGELVTAMEQERFSRQKHTWEFPSDAIRRCIADAGLQAGDITDVAVSIDPWKGAFRKALFAPRLGTRVAPFLKHETLRAWGRERGLQSWFGATFDDRRPPRLTRVGHHVAHVAGSFLVSPFERAALLSLDGSGEWSTSWLGSGDDRSFNCLAESHFPHSLGAFYEAATEFCGFRPNYDEGKTMGLAPCGDPGRFYPAMSRLVSVDERGRIHTDLSYFLYQNWGHRRCGPKYHAVFGEPRAPDAPIEQRHMDLAAAAQQVLEERALELCRVLERRCGERHLVIAGGVALNSVMNGRILREAGFDDIYVMPAAGDAGTALGAAYYVHHVVHGQPGRYHHRDPYLGTAYSDAEIEKLLRECKLPYTRSTDVCGDTARMLRDGRIVGWFQGRMEVGPRSLGNRSILCDPTLPHMKDKVNAEVKHREAFRPFAPSVPANRAHEYFDMRGESPFMLTVWPVRPEFRSRLPAITHVDGSARVQTVRPDVNPRFHDLLEAFGRSSGIPVVLNTSFNVMGEPMVESPLQAIRCFYGTGIDTLVIGDFIVEKRAW